MRSAGFSATGWRRDCLQHLLMDRVSLYRKHAEACRELEKTAQSEEERALLRELARHWDAVADIRARLADPEAGPDDDLTA
jgi:hypothetical protein